MADVTLPQLGETVTEGTITQWFKAVGDAIEVDEPLYEVSTDKVDSEVPSPATGVLTEIRVPEGETVDVGTVLAVVSDAGLPPPREAAAAEEPEATPPPSAAPTPAAPPADAAPQPSTAEPAPPPPPTREAPARVAPEPAAASATSPALLSPLVRRLVDENGLDPTEIAGTGSGGRITRADVEAAAGSRGANGRQPQAPPTTPPVASQAPAVRPSPAPGERDTEEPFNRMRRRTGEHMEYSLSVAPHVLMTCEVDYEVVERVRRRHGEAFRDEEGIELNYLPFVSLAVVDAIREFPRVNASVGDGSLIIHHDINLGIAVDLHHEGLIVPVVHDADSKRLRAVAREIAALAHRARTGDLSAGRRHRRHLHRLQPRSVRDAVHRFDHQPTAGRDPLHGRRGAQAGGGDGRRRQRGDRHPLGRVCSPSASTIGPSTAPTPPRSSIGCASDHPDPRLGNGAGVTLRVRWLGRVAHRDADALMHGLAVTSADDHLLLLEHPHTYTLGVHADPAHLLVDASTVGAEVVRADRGGDVTYHGPGQLVGYPVRWLPGKGAGDRPDTVAYVHDVEQLVIDVLADLGIPDAARLEGFPGVWVAGDGPRPAQDRRDRGAHQPGPHVARLRDQRRPGSRDVRAHRPLRDHGQGRDLAARRRRHGFAARGRRRRRGDEPSARWAPDGQVDRAEVVWRQAGDGSDLAPFSRGEGPATAGPADVAPSLESATTEVSSQRRARLSEAGVTTGLQIGGQKPSWTKGRMQLTPGYTAIKRTMRDLELVTVCEEAGCPNIAECWTDGTATFMINGERCTRACGFCLVDTRKPLPLDPTEPERVAEAVERMGLDHAVVTCVARDDLADGGASGFASTIAAIRRRNADDHGRGPDLGLQGRPGGARDDLRGTARCAQPQHRDRRPAAARRAPVGLLRPVVGRAGPCEGRRSRDQGQPHGRHRRDRRRGAQHPGRPAWGRGRHRDRGPVPAADRGAPAGDQMGDARRVRRLRGSREGRWASATSRRRP